MTTIIKAEGTTGSPREPRGIPFNLVDVAEQAQGQLDEVRRQAAKIVVQAQRDADHIRRRAEAEGRQAALLAAEKTARARVEQQLQTLLPALQQAIEGIRQSRQAWLRHWEQAAVGLATRIAARVIRRQIALEPQITLDLIRESLELAAGASRMKLHMNPADLEALGESARALVDEAGMLGPIDVVADPAVSPGGCRATTEFGQIDQRVETQLARIEEELTQ
jgi:flagellar assembly protein FliH